MITDFNNNHYNSRFWRIKSMYKAMKFAWKNPQHVQVSIKNTSIDGFEMNANYAGINEKGFLRVLMELGTESYHMQKTEEELKDLMN